MMSKGENEDVSRKKKQIFKRNNKEKSLKRENRKDEKLMV